MTRRRPALRAWPAAALLLLPATGCDRPVEGTASVASAAPADAVPDSSTALEALVVDRVASGRPRLPDAQVVPPAGSKTVEDVARYAEDPARERRVLRGYGYRWGWERFFAGQSSWQTGVYVDQFEHRAGADAYAADLAANGADRHGGLLHDDPPGLPGGCWLLTVDDPRPGDELAGPAALSWCGHGVFSVAVTVVAPSAAQAEAEVQAVLADQLDRLPPG